ncbi:Predicted chitinase [Pseudoxanthomonas sp. CF385]|uniref:glycoside hydrolase family 19 protein n=1 Tax=Pseudoxanthomonas sp. CF385 TaxID=1881042 RepID=UPI00088E4913|nr:glycoside hydrolase family 19 protein [Pseudoxanthomonas sp. CF385]SDQ57089.1 Predicted chitinase [Pseudoxanthomonas sp. CF385]
MPSEHEISMLRAARDAGITSREEMANFMAQMGHESTGFTRLEESFRYTRGIHQIPVRSAWREGAQALENARQEALEGRPRELGRLMYGERMGNDNAGDGYLYRGRGYTQLTGENNYRAADEALNLDLIANPALASDRDNAERIAIWFWQNQVPEQDRDDVTRATLAINNGENGLKDRLNRYDAWHAALTPDFVAQLDLGRIRAGAGIAPTQDRPAMEDGALRRFEDGGEVRQLNSHLRALDVRAERNRQVPEGDTFTRETEQAIRLFQEQQAVPTTGRADPATLETIERELRQRQDPPATDERIGIESSNHKQQHGAVVGLSGTGNAELDRLASALASRDETAISEACTRIAQSPHVRALEEWAREPATPQRMEETQQQEMARQLESPGART